MKYAWIDAHRNEYELAELCRVLAWQSASAATAPGSVVARQSASG